jgi:hypothetical protein
MLDTPRPTRESVRFLVVSLLAWSLQGLFLGYALQHAEEPAAWAAWAVVFVFCAVAFTIATRRGMRLARKRRQELGWEQPTRDEKPRERGS